MQSPQTENEPAPWHIRTILEDWLREHESELFDRREPPRAAILPRAEIIIQGAASPCSYCGGTASSAAW
jgi:hypothetical protein